MIHKNRPLLKAELECTNCKLHATCRFTNKMDVWGSKNPTFLFVGEAPGETEDVEGVPFIGRAGAILRDIIREIGFKDSEYAIVNSCRCWPGPKNPTPKDPEIRACRPYLIDDIERLNPKVIIMLGATALKAVSNKSGITKLRGTVWEKDGRFYVPTFHPSATFYDKEKLRDIIDDIEKAYVLPNQGIPEPEDVNWAVITDFDDVVRVFDLIKDQKDLAFDYETNTNLSWEDGAQILTAGYCWEEGTAVSIPVYHRESGFTPEQQQAIIDMIDALHRYRKENGLYMMAYNAVFDIMFGKVAHGISEPLLGDDPYIGHHCINEEMSKPSLSQLTWMYLPIGGYDNELLEMKKENPKLYDPKRGGNYGNFPLNILGYYNAGDVDATLRLAHKFEEILKRDNLYEVYWEVELQSTFPIMDYIANGVQINVPFLKELVATYQQRVDGIITDCRELADVKKWERKEYLAKKKEYDDKERERQQKWREEETLRLAEGKKPRKPLKPLKRRGEIIEFHPNKDAHVRGVLFDICKFKPIKETPTGLASVDSGVREELMEAHPLVPMLDDFASMNKFKTSYIDRLDKIIEGGEYSIFHPKFDLTGTVTGRLVGDMQQLPRTATNADIKKLFISRFGDRGILLNSDIKSAEVRMLGIVSGDPILKNVFDNNLDPHSMSACLVYRWEYDEFIARIHNKDPEAEEIRSKMKTVTFGLIYGKEGESFARDFGWELDKAERFVKQYFDQYPRVRQWIGDNKMFASVHGYVLNVFNRRRRIPAAMKSAMVQQWERERALRQAINFIIQSSTHDTMMYCTTQIRAVMLQLGLESKLVGEVHDSLVIDSVVDEVDTVVEVIDAVFSSLPMRYEWVTIPMEIEVKAGPNLAQMEQIFG